MSMDLVSDLNCYFEDWGVDITLRPGETGERLIEKGGVFSRSSELADVGGQVQHVLMPTSLNLRNADAQGIEQGDAVTVHPSAELGIAGGDFHVSAVLPGEAGLTVLELIEA